MPRPDLLPCVFQPELDLDGRMRAIAAAVLVCGAESGDVLTATFSQIIPRAGTSGTALNRLKLKNAHAPLFGWARGLVLLHTQHLPKRPAGLTTTSAGSCFASSPRDCAPGSGTGVARAAGFGGATHWNGATLRTGTDGVRRWTIGATLEAIAILWPSEAVTRPLSEFARQLCMEHDATFMVRLFSAVAPGGPVGGLRMMPGRPPLARPYHLKAYVSEVQRASSSVPDDLAAELERAHHAQQVALFRRDPDLAWQVAQDLVAAGEAPPTPAHAEVFAALYTERGLPVPAVLEVQP